MKLLYYGYYGYYFNIKKMSENRKKTGHELTHADRIKGGLSRSPNKSRSAKIRYLKQLRKKDPAKFHARVLDLIEDENKAKLILGDMAEELREMFPSLNVEQKLKVVRLYKDVIDDFHNKNVAPLFVQQNVSTAGNSLEEFFGCPMSDKAQVRRKLMEGLTGKKYEDLCRRAGDDSERTDDSDGLRAEDRE